MAMKWVDRDKCHLELNFTPKRPWPKVFPSMSWKNWMIAGFENSSSPVLDLSDMGSLAVALHSCHPQLSLSELARLYTTIEHGPLNAEIDWTDFFSRYGLHSNENLKLTLSKLNQCPIPNMASHQLWNLKSEPSHQCASLHPTSGSSLSSFP